MITSQTRELVDNTALREAFESSGLTAGDVARRMGWTRRQGKTRKDGRRAGPWMCADISRVKRALGLNPEGGSRNGGKMRREIDYDTALRLAEAIGVDPTDVGL